ncbi:hypothetical protein BDB01DRAFT_795991 [Pilobolus umbonatus]|nr:hypothetical protein BDB01DRAFT_795991 [Pilobolus umbonatus]
MSTQEVEDIHGFIDRESYKKSISAFPYKANRSTLEGHIPIIPYKDRNSWKINLNKGKTHKLGNGVDTTSTLSNTVNTSHTEPVRATMRTSKNQEQRNPVNNTLPEQKRADQERYADFRPRINEDYIVSSSNPLPTQIAELELIVKDMEKSSTEKRGMKMIDSLIDFFTNRKKNSSGQSRPSNSKMNDARDQGYPNQEHNYSPSLQSLEQNPKAQNTAQKDARENEQKESWRTSRLQGEKDLSNQQTSSSGQMTYSNQAQSSGSQGRQQEPLQNQQSRQPQVNQTKKDDLQTIHPEASSSRINNSESILVRRPRRKSTGNEDDHHDMAVVNRRRASYHDLAREVERNTIYNQKSPHVNRPPNFFYSSSREHVYGPGYNRTHEYEYINEYVQEGPVHNRMPPEYYIRRNRKSMTDMDEYYTGYEVMMRKPYHYHNGATPIMLPYVDRYKDTRAVYPRRIQSPHYTPSPYYQ